MNLINKYRVTFLLFLSLSQINGAVAGQLQIAVSANFFKPLKVISAQFEKQSGHKVSISVGSTGKLYAQIINGAPFDIFLAADQRRPFALVEKGFALENSQFTYAKGALLLWSSDENQVDELGLSLRDPTLQYLAITNPKTAPYGSATIAVLKKLELYEQLKDKLVEGQNVGQTYQHINTEVVKQGFIPLSQVMIDGKITKGSSWLVPSDLYPEIKQDAVLLKQGENNPVATLFLAFLREDKTLSILHSFGYKG